MRSDLATVQTRCCATAVAAALLFAAVAVRAAQQVPYAGVGTAVHAPPPQDARYYYMMVTVYKMLYCDQKQCPKWRCQDDSAVIHGYCCGCPAPLLGHVPVPCVEDLKCPLKTRDLCEHYHFMTTCCC